MQAQTQVPATPEQLRKMEEKLQKVRELYADAPELGKAALERGMATLKQELAAASTAQSAGRVGARQGKVSELTLIVPFAKGGAKRLRGFLQALEGNFHGADIVGSVHDMRFVFLDNDTKLLFATAYDGEWDAYIDDFTTKIPNSMDLWLCNCEDYPGMSSGKGKEWIAKHQISADAWYVANPNLTVPEVKRLGRIGKALDQFLDAVG